MEFFIFLPNILSIFEGEIPYAGLFAIILSIDKISPFF